MTFLSSLFTWANVPFVVTFGVAVLFGILQMTGALSLLADGDHDGDGHVDAAEGGDAHGDVEHAHSGNDVGVGDAHSHGIGNFLGIGRVPVGIVWQTFAVVFGFSGILLNTIAWTRFGVLRTSNLLWVLPLSLLLATLLTAAVSRTIGKVVAAPNTSGVTREGLVGLTGVVISSKVDDKFGEVRLRAADGVVVRVVVTTRDNEAPIVEGSEVVVIESDGAGRPVVTALERPEESSSKRSE